MKPEHGPRRIIIREWMAMPKDKRQNREQAVEFSVKAAERHVFRCSGERAQKIMGWILPRVAKG